MKWILASFKLLIIILFGLFQVYLSLAQSQVIELLGIIFFSSLTIAVVIRSMMKRSLVSSHWSIPLVLTILFATVAWGWRLLTITNVDYAIELAFKYGGMLLVQWAFFSVWFCIVFESLRFKIGSFLTAFVVLGAWMIWLSSASWSNFGFMQLNARWALLSAIMVSLVIRVRTKRADWALANVLIVFIIGGVIQPLIIANGFSFNNIQLMLYTSTWDLVIGWNMIVLVITLILTRRPRKLAGQLRHIPIAHRGFYSDTAPENTLPAYDEAIRHRFAIECDVRLTKDQQLVMFHDDTLKRQFDDDRSINECELAELQHLVFPGTSTTIPTFEQMLHRVHGQVLLVIELKPMGNQRRRLVEAVLQELECYEGEFVLQSFDPLTMLIVAELAPHVVRGQLYFNYAGAKVSPLTRWLLARLLFNVMTFPDFLNGYHLYHLPLVQLYRKWIPVIGYTVTHQTEFDAAKKWYDNLIFEHFIPSSFPKGEV